MRLRDAAVLLPCLLGPSEGCTDWCNKWTCRMAGCTSCGAEIGCPAKPPPPPLPPPLPQRPPWHQGLEPGFINFASSDGVLHANGVPFSVKGVNWFGSEGRSGPPLGLDRHDIAWYCRFLAANGFNAIRFLFNHEMILSNPELEPPDESIYGVGAPWEAPELEAFHYLEMFARLSEVAAEHGILVMMACHRLTPNAWPGNGKWYDGRITEERVKQSWETIADRLCSQWNVFAVDLQNEPHTSSWGLNRGERSDWGKAAERLGNWVLSLCPRWLIMVEGVGYDPGTSEDDPTGGIFWGENLAGALHQPVILTDQSKLVYSPHTYGPAVYEQDYFRDASFPSNMPAIWEFRFGFTPRRLKVPLCIGEFGGTYEKQDKVWQDWAIGFMRDRGIGLFYFALNPSSADTGGLLQEDYTTPEAEKLALLASLLSTNVLPLRSMSRPPSMSPPTPLRLSPPPPPPRPPPRRSSPPSPPPPQPASLPPSPSASPLPPAPQPAPALPSSPPPPQLDSSTPAAAAVAGASSIARTRHLPHTLLDGFVRRCAFNCKIASGVVGIGLLLMLIVGTVIVLRRRSHGRRVDPLRRAELAPSMEDETPSRRRTKRSSASTKRRPKSRGHLRLKNTGTDDVEPPSCMPSDPSDDESTFGTDTLAAEEDAEHSDDEMTSDPRSLSVRELKARLTDLGVDVDDCIEKADLVRRYEQRQTQMRRLPTLTFTCSTDASSTQNARARGRVVI